jgi:hypothetical protein
MRSDMHKVIVERPRPQSRHDFDSHKVRMAKKVSLNEDGDVEDNYGNHMSAKASKYRGDTRSFNENLSPLYRWFDSKVGKKWDDVYSELRAGLNMDSTVQAHVMQHARDQVSLHCYYDEDGKLLSDDHNRRRNYGAIPNYVYGLYVDPKDGILKDAGKYNWKKESRFSTQNNLARIEERRRIRVIDKTLEFNLKDVCRKNGTKDGEAWYRTDIISTWIKEHTIEKYRHIRTFGIHDKEDLVWLKKSNGLDLFRPVSENPDFIKINVIVPGKWDVKKNSYLANKKDIKKYGLK